MVTDPMSPDPESGALRVVAHGGGVQSTALLVLSAQGKIDFPIHLFCNVGDDSEHPDTLDYVHNVGMPYAAKHGIELHEIHRTWQDGREPLTLLQHQLQMKGTAIPMRGANGAPQSRQCTEDFKILVISKWLKANGATPENPATVAIGISVDEIGRATVSRRPYELREHPLLDLGLRRSDCYRIIEEAGLPEPPKSSCFFCPFHRPQVWSEMRRDRLDLFDKACEIEAAVIAKELAAGRRPVYLTRFGRPLREAIGVAQDTFPLFDDNDPMGEDGCDEGVCFV